MSKNTPITQHLDFEGETWNVDRINFSKNFDKFYTKPDGQVVIENLNITYEEMGEEPVSIAHVTTLPIDVAIDSRNSDSEIIQYFSSTFQINGFGDFIVSMTYYTVDNILTVSMEFVADNN